MNLKEEYKEQLVNDICRFVRIPSRSTAAGGEEGPLQTLIADRMWELGARVRVLEPDDIPAFRGHPLCHGPDRQYTGRPTVLAELGPADAPGLLILAHSDTVPINDPEDWTFDPFCGDVRDGVIRGLGCGDDKWGLAAMLVIMHALTRSPHSLKKRLVFASTIDEESGVGNGTLLLTLVGVKAEQALYLDGHEMKLFLGNLGGSNLYLRPKNPISPEAWTRHADCLEAACRELSRRRASRPLPPPFENNDVKNKTVGLRTQTDAKGRFFTIGFYTFPNEPREQVRRELEETVAEALGPDLSMYDANYREPWFETALIPKETPIVQCLSASIRDLLGREPEVTTMPKGDAFVLCNLAGIPTVWFGPRSKPWDRGGYHKPDEYLRIDEVWDACRIAYAAVCRWLEMGTG